MNAPTEPSTPKARFQITVRRGAMADAFVLHETRQWLIGRGSDCALKIEEAAVSRHHARLHLRGDTVEVEDLGSANGTWLIQPVPAGHAAAPNERRLAAHERTRLRSGESLRIGQVLLELSRVARAEPRPTPMMLTAPEPVLDDPAMRNVYDLVTRAARRGISILILGETGVGKELLAQTVHRSSARAHAPFLILNCAALPETLLELELFGHEKGAFIGAETAEPGLLEETDGGTVFLDEIGELPLGMQSRLLRVLEERVVLRVGSRKPRSIDIRFVTATQRDLLAEIRTGQFRGDLYYRISGVSVRVPPLRERPGDLEPLARHFVQQFSAAAGERAPELTAAALAVLRKHHWPGNVRELKNVIERAVLIADGGVLGQEHILLDQGGAPATREPESWDVPTSVDEAAELTPSRGRDPNERARLITALDACAGNQRRAAELLGISRRTLVNRLNKWNLPRPKKVPSGTTNG